MLFVSSLRREGEEANRIGMSLFLEAECFAFQTRQRFVPMGSNAVTPQASAEGRGV